ncbi:MAG: hybrid sensor histidine kinase/response regulator [Petrimonas sp.]|nr:hybrid sensor histidine kinase/response regulator [Petrimonas sp.]
MKYAKYASNVKYVVIAGYVLVVVVMVIGLVSVYRNLVDFSEKKIRNEDLSELMIVSTTLSKLYEIESSQNLANAELAQQYFNKYDSILPHVQENIDTLKILSKDTARHAKLDTISLLLGQKRHNLIEISSLLDSLKRAPSIKREVQNSYVPSGLNKEIRDYLKDRIENPKETVGTSDTTVVKQDRKGFLDRVRNVFNPKEDSLVMIRQTTPLIETDSFRFVIDTVVKMVRYSERLDLARQRKIQEILMARQLSMNYMNTALTSRIDDLLKGIENEEMEKSIQLISDKNKALNSSQRIVYIVSWLALLIAVIFGLLFLLDINRIQRYRKQLEASNEKIRQLLDAREQLMLSISHDIKAPMSSILGYIELMLPPITDEKKNLYLGNMKNSSEHVLQLVINLLDYHKLESGEWAFKEINFNVRDLVENTATSFRPIAEQKELQLIVNNKINGELMSHGDPYILRQILSNLISNAIKFTNKGSVTVTAAEEFVKMHSWLRLQVKDTGVGIDKEDQLLIFREFKRLEGKNAYPSAEGSGLGLAIVKGLVDELGGSVTLESEKGKGAEFTVLIPLKKVEETERNSAFDNDIVNYDFAGVSILAVDDDEVQLTMMSEMLKTKNAKVVTESNPLKVPDILRTNKFDIIFIDIQMPVTNGFALVSDIRKLDVNYVKSIPVIALSAKSGVSSADLEEAGFSGFMTKPFSSEQLFFNIYHFVNEKTGKKTNNFIFGDKKTVSGVAALVDFVKDDKEASTDILQAFVDDTGKNIEKMRNAFVEYDQTASSQLAHKMLPLFRMIADEKLVKYLSNLENKVKLMPEEKDAVLTLLEKYNHDAKELVAGIAKK